jgi:hypothetical protein
MSQTDTKEQFSVVGLEQQGLTGFLTVRDLRESKLEAVPQGPGIYVVLRSLDGKPAFLDRSKGGWFKGNDPTVARAILDEKWVIGADVVYVGKATAGSSGRGGLRKRLGQLVEYGSGKPTGHQGGRYLWQVPGSDEFVVAWRVVEDPTTEENRILSAFSAAYGAYPFANIAGPRA